MAKRNKEFEEKVMAHAQHKAWSIARYVCLLLQKRGLTTDKFAKESGIPLNEVKDILCGVPSEYLVEISRMEIALGDTIIATPEELQAHFLGDPEGIRAVMQELAARMARKEFAEISELFELIEQRVNFIPKEETE